MTDNCNSRPSHKEYHTSTLALIRLIPIYPKEIDRISLSKSTGRRVKSINRTIDSLSSDVLLAENDDGALCFLDRNDKKASIKFYRSRI